MNDKAKRRNWTSKENIILIVVVLVVLVAVVGITAFIFYGESIKPKLDDEVFKLTYQFLLIVVLGGAVSLIYNAFTEQRARKQQRLVILREIYAELLAAYNAAKRIRRKFRAHVGYSKSGLTEGATVYKYYYMEQMDILINAQLVFENHKKRAKDKKLHYEQGKELSDHLDTIERYLNCIIDEYQEQLQSFAGDPPGRALSQLPELKDFLEKSTKSKKFREGFKRPGIKALDSLADAGLL